MRKRMMYSGRQRGSVRGTAGWRRRKRPEKNFRPQVLPLCQAADVVFMALHGANGEDGRVQAVFDLFGIRYTGTTV